MPEETQHVTDPGWLAICSALREGQHTGEPIFFQARAVPDHSEYLWSRAQYLPGGELSGWKYDEFQTFERDPHAPWIHHLVDGVQEETEALADLLWQQYELYQEQTV